VPRIAPRTEAAMRDAELIARWIEPHPRRPGVAEARVKGYATPVWALVGHWRAVGRNVGRVAEDYDLPREAVEAALAYYRRHRPLIDARLAENNAVLTQVLTE